MSSINQLRNRLLGSRKLRVQVVGIEQAGTTTMVQAVCKCGLSPQNHSTDVWGNHYSRVTVNYPPGWELDVVEVWDGCSKFYLKYGGYHFVTSDTLIWVLHDCTTQPGRSFLSMYLRDMQKRQAKYVWVILTKQDLLPASERETIVAAHRARIEADLKAFAEPAGFTGFIVDTPGFNLLEGDFVARFVQGVTRDVVQLEKDRAMRLRDHRKVQHTAAERTPSEEELRTGVEKAVIADAEVFWGQFETGELQAWGHVEHLQAGYLVMLRSMEEGHGMLKCAEVFLGHLERLREAKPDIFRNSAHFTMTAFWLIQLRIATFNYQYDIFNDSLAPKPSWFRAVLLHTPFLLNTNLWAEYYTKPTLFSTAARTAFVMPDVQRFPQVTRTVLTGGQQQQEDNEEDPEWLLRWAFAVVVHDVMCPCAAPRRRGAVVKEALEALRDVTVRERGRGMMMVPVYSETQAYFWVQFVHAKLAGSSDSAGRKMKDKDVGVLSDDEEAEFTFERFKEEFEGVSSEAWREYYSREVWEAVGARIQFVVPDKKALPNVLAVMD